MGLASSFAQQRVGQSRCIVSYCLFPFKDTAFLQLWGESNGVTHDSHDAGITRVTTVYEPQLGESEKGSGYQRLLEAVISRTLLLHCVLFFCSYFLFRTLHIFDRGESREYSEWQISFFSITPTAW